MKLGLFITGGVAASLMPGWLLYLRTVQEWDIEVALTHTAQSFVSVAALEAINGKPVALDTAWLTKGTAQHKTLSAGLDAIAICPASFNTCGKLSSGIADDIVSATAAFAHCPVIVFPAFSAEDVGARREVVLRRMEEMGYRVSRATFPAVEVADGGTKTGQGFPTIDKFIAVINQEVAGA
ncbi:flavoprotein [Corynebacterium hindlerae]|uniref:Flavoprotein n=1 Tax=Corynebacterium hindlerae TaxID=699041 RepID=A0A7G5FD21_9CORY|nr:flavoprotein [Corynebacterium hindlerae]QMV84512.1 flavoprotein [Corynebacterium hindlerae]